MYACTNIEALHGYRDPSITDIETLVYMYIETIRFYIRKSMKSLGQGFYDDTSKA